MASPGCRLVDAPALPAYDLGRDHPFARDRLLPLFDLIRRLDLVQESELLRPAAATDAEIGTAHEPAYVDAVRRLSAAPDDRELRRTAPLFGLGTADNPIARGQHEGACAVAGASLACVRGVLSGAVLRGFNPAGGLHHAMPAAASGFCIYNDLVIAIRAARQLGAARVAYVDFDVHHGDGVEYAFRQDPTVLTISFHETPDARWPYTGRVDDRGEGAGLGSAIDVPFASHTADRSWQRCVRAVLEQALPRFRPDLLITQHGCDPHFEDPLAELDLTTASFRFAAELSRELADRQCGGRWVATGGGGYQPYRVIPRAWSMVWSVIADRELPDAVDPAWIDAWQEHSHAPLPRRFLDGPFEHPKNADAERANEAMLARLHEVHGW